MLRVPVQEEPELSAKAKIPPVDRSSVLLAVRLSVFLQNGNSLKHVSLNDVTLLRAEKIKYLAKKVPLAT